LVVLAAVIWNWDALPEPEGWFVDDTKYRVEIAAAARRHGLDPELVRAVIFRESRFNPRARGSSGEIGLMQVLPTGAAAEWARVLKRPCPAARDLFDVETNLEVGCWYLARALRRWRNYDHGVELALAQYNAGESRAQKWAPQKTDGDVLSRVNIASTRKYITKIMKRYRKYTAAAAEKI
jgi:soluble lytic murein transglycosylase